MRGCFTFSHIFYDLFLIIKIDKHLKAIGGLISIRRYEDNINSI